MDSYSYGSWHQFGPWNVVMIIIYIALIVVPCAKILGKAGYSGWWSFFALIPLINVIALWVFAFSPWPRLTRTTGSA